MFNLLKCELYKLRHSTGFMVMIILSALFGTILALSFSFAEVISGGVNLSGYEAFYTMFGDLRTFMLIFVGVFSGIFIGEDFSFRAFQAEIALGNSRLKVLLSKTIVYMLGILLMIIIWQVFVVTIVSVVNGFGEIASMVLIANMVRASLMFAFHICACSMICVFTSVLLKNKAAILAVNFLILIFVDGIFQGISMISDKGMEIYMKTPFLQALIFSSPEVNLIDTVYSLIIGLVIIIGLFLTSHFVFNRRELK